MRRSVTSTGSPQASGTVGWATPATAPGIIVAGKAYGISSKTQHGNNRLQTSSPNVGIAGSSLEKATDRRRRGSAAIGWRWGDPVYCAPGFVAWGGLQAWLTRSWAADLVPFLRRSPVPRRQTVPTTHRRPRLAHDLAAIGRLPAVPSARICHHCRALAERRTHQPPLREPRCWRRAAPEAAHENKSRLASLAVTVGDTPG